MKKTKIHNKALASERFTPTLSCFYKERYDASILDMPGAEDLLGKGDMLMVTDNDIMRMQGLFVSEEELESFIADYCGCV